MGVVAIVAISNGNPDRLTMGTDSYGLVCGSVNQKVFGDATYEIDLSNRVGFERTKGVGVGGLKEGLPVTNRSSSSCAPPPSPADGADLPGPDRH